MKNLSPKIGLVIAALVGNVGIGFALPDCPSDTRASWDLCVGIHTYSNGSKYFGEWKDGKRHGQGIEYFTNGAVSEGFYKNDIAQERRTPSYSLETFILKISFKRLSIKQRKSIQLSLKKLGLYNSSIDGLYGKRTEGALTTFNIQNLDSVNLRKSENVLKLFSAVNRQKVELAARTQTEKTELPKCTNTSDLKISNSCVGRSSKTGIDCFGILRNGIANGQGTYTYSDGSQYVGEFKDCKRQGQGIFTFGKDTRFAGNKYVGEFKDDNYHGQGIFIFGAKSEFAGDKYFGEFEDNKKNGQGTYTYTDGSKYVGEYKDDKRTGQGTYNLTDGSNYIGEWKDGKANGKGTHTLADGSKYVGEYKNGKPYGKSTKVWLNGTSKEGIWREGVFTFE